MRSAASSSNKRRHHHPVSKQQRAIMVHQCRHRTCAGRYAADLRRMAVEVLRRGGILFLRHR